MFIYIYIYIYINKLRIKVNLQLRYRPILELYSRMANTNEIKNLCTQA